MKNRRYINSYASTAAIINLQSQIDDIKAGGGGGSGGGGDTSALEARVANIENSLKNYPTSDALDTAIAGVEGQIDAVEATVSDKLGVDDVAVWAKSEDPITIPLEKMDENIVEYSDFSYVPGGESDPVVRKTIQLANYDSISGKNVAGNDAANLIMMSKWDKVDIGSSRYPVNLNGSEFTLNDNRDIAKVYETKALTDLQEGAGEDEIKEALGVEFEDFIEIIQDKNVVIADRNSAGDYKACIHASGNISGGNGAANLMFFIGTTPTIYQIQYISGTYALAVNKYEFAEKDEIPSLDEYAKKDEILNTVVDESRNETLAQSLTARTYLPFARNSDLENQTEAQIFALFSNNVTDRASLREYVQSNMAYISYNLDSLGEHQYYKSTILMASVPDDGDITVIAIAADIYNDDKLSKFTYTITLNGDASSVHIEKKALEA